MKPRIVTNKTARGRAGSIIVTSAMAVLCGCAQTPVYTPSTKPLQEDLGRAQTHITQAKGISATIHDKDQLIDSYYKWKATHK
jgi:hypothetical protein